MYNRGAQVAVSLFVTLVCTSLVVRDRIQLNRQAKHTSEVKAVALNTAGGMRLAAVPRIGILRAPFRVESPVDSMRNAIKFNDTTAVRRLLLIGTNVNAPDTDDISAIDYSVIYGRIAIMKLLVSHSAKPDLSYALVNAVGLGRKDMVQALLQFGADVNSPGKYFGETTSGGAEQELANLKGYGYHRLSGRSQDCIKVTPLEIAAEMNRCDLYRLLRRHNAVDNIFLASAMGDIDRVHQLAEGSPALINSHNSINDSPLMLSLIRNHPQVARWLLDHGADTGGSASTRDCPLALAAMLCGTDVVNSLIDHGAAVDGFGANRASALLRAANAGRLDSVKALIARGASVNFRGLGGTTGLILAVRSGNVSVVRALVASGADVEAKDNAGDTALTLARRRNMPAIVDLLQIPGQIIG